jgi:4-amino-4-deoxy-L-arabinose transferase-like glycosyltransferase
MNKSGSNKNLGMWLGLVLILSLFLRVMLFAIYSPVSFSDTGGYQRSAQAVLNGFENYDGTRTPVYPILIALTGSEKMLYISQLFLGLGITLAWFIIGWKVSRKPFIGALIALAHTLNPGQFFFEANLLTETLAAFWLILSLLGAYFWLADRKYHSTWLALGIGISTSLAALTRPQFIFMPLWLAIFLAFSCQDRKCRFNFKPFVGLLLPALVLIGGWMAWVYSRYNILSVTTMSGFHLVQHAGYYFEDLPDEFAAIRDTYIAFRDTRLDAFGTQSNTIWEAIPALQEASGLNFYDLSQTLQELSLKLILTHPWQYLERVLKGWFWFWRAPVYWRQSAFTLPGISNLMVLWVWLARGLMVLMNLVFVLSSIAALISKRVRHFFNLSSFHWLLAGTVWITSIFTSLLEHGENQRFLIPLQTAVIFWAIWIIYFTWQARTRNPGTVRAVN